MDYALSAYYGWSVDYMLYHSGLGAPLLPDIANALAARGLRPIFTMMIFVMYIVIAAIIVSIVRLVCFLRGKRGRALR